MELAGYADLAVRLVNSEPGGREGTGDGLADLAGLRRLLADRPAWRSRAALSDLPRLRLTRARLREVFEAAARGEDRRAVRALNELLSSAAVRPQVSGHDRQGWHLHLSDAVADLAAAYTAAAATGLAVQLSELGVDRLGTCAALRCGRVFVDTSTNRSRRYCSDRCATRANVAAFRARARRRAAAG